MDTGLALWSSESFAFERDYLLPLPQPDLQGALERRAEYPDAAVFTQKLLGMLSDDDGSALLQPGVSTFWSEHSDRAGGGFIVGVSRGLSGGQE